MLSWPSNGSTMMRCDMSINRKGQPSRLMEQILDLTVCCVILCYRLHNWHILDRGQLVYWKVSTSRSAGQITTPERLMAVLTLTHEAEFSGIGSPNRLGKNSSRMPDVS